MSSPTDKGAYVTSAYTPSDRLLTVTFGSRFCWTLLVVKMPSLLSQNLCSCNSSPLFYSLPFKRPNLQSGFLPFL